MATRAPFSTGPRAKGTLLPQEARLAAPRIAINQINQIQPGQDITVIARAVDAGGLPGTFKFGCVICNEEFLVNNMEEVEVSMVMELTLRPNAAGQGTFSHVTSGMVNDDFDAQRYKELVGLISQHRELFY